MVGLSLFSNQGCEIGLSETENPSLHSSVGWGGGGGAWHGFAAHSLFS